LLLPLIVDITIGSVSTITPKDVYHLDFQSVAFACSCWGPCKQEIVVVRIKLCINVFIFITNIVTISYLYHNLFVSGEYIACQYTSTDADSSYMEIDALLLQCLKILSFWVLCF